MMDVDADLRKELDAVFRSEAADLFMQIESAVLDLESGTGGGDAVHRLFRAVHTLKGSGAMFGLIPLAELAHELENLIERVRELEIQPDRRLISLVLRVTDRLRVLAESQGEDEGDDAPLLKDMAGALADLEKGADASGLRKVSVFFRPFTDIFKSGMDPAMVLEELRELGRLEVRFKGEDVPDLASLNPEQCSLAFDMVLETDAKDEDIEEVFLFVSEDSDVRIRPFGSEDSESTTREDALTERVIPQTIKGHGDSSGEDFSDGDSSERVMVQKELSDEKKDSPSPPAANGMVSSGKSADHPHPDSEDIRIAAPRLDTLMNLVGELVMQQARLKELGRTLKIPELEESLEGLDLIALNLKDCVLNLRMTPIAATFNRFRRLVRDLCQELGKEVNFEVTGGETELDKALIDGLGEPLVHLVRNALDHGIELPEERLEKGKPATGTLRLAAAAAEGRVEICVFDDGRGIDRDAVLEKARKRKLVREGELLSPSEIDALVFHPGLSTSTAVGKVSGRGVGMDVVRRQIESISGRIAIESQAQKGTKIVLSLPLTLAIVECLMVRVGEGLFALPITQVETCMDFMGSYPVKEGDQRWIYLRNRPVSYVFLRDFFRIRSRQLQDAHVVVVRSESGFFGLVVDALAGTQQVVIKSMGDWYDRQDGIAGATVMGDGDIAFVLDVQGLWRRACAEASGKNTAKTGEASLKQAEGKG
ncbi:two-component system chemotaxis sensor kinase CheA [Desulfobotulus alkaliphilus]|uniref:Chemotaxis protein CheA n=1 Tax=Desulfobotulus alkaliphilus TaxID=622671 RepID=A0A562RSA6_9BACT|nr:chemotaxis protein CheA [Desulfobotulus alkaliphilus]TWI71216.1 two-component system chemotaxis sensor kinase CheA [Desulfobotulus alkaliphilus]